MKQNSKHSQKNKTKIKIKSQSVTFMKAVM